MNAQNAALRELLQSVPRLPRKAGALEVQAGGAAGWAMGMVSWVAAGPDGLSYLLQRGEHADPVIVVDRNGRIGFARTTTHMPVCRILGSANIAVDS